MVSSRPNNEKSRKDKICKANSILLRFDQQNMSGKVTFHFGKGQGITGHDTQVFDQWNTYTTNETTEVYIPKNDLNKK